MRVGDKLREKRKEFDSKDRARAFADVAQFKIGKGLQSRAYLEHLHMFLQDYCFELRTSLAQK